MYVTRFTFYRLVERDNRHSFTRCFHLLLLRKSQIDTTELYLYVTLHPFICCYRNEERFPLLLETNNALKIVTQAYFNSEQTIDFCVVKVFMVLLETKKKFLKLTKRLWVHYIPNEQRFIFLSLCCYKTNNAFRIVTQTYFDSEHTIDLCVVKVFMVLLETRKKFSQAYETSVSKKRLHTKWTTLQFVVGNEQRLIRLLGTNNALRIFMVLSEKKSALVTKNFSMLLLIYSLKFWSF